jgi:hypothetical protein
LSDAVDNDSGAPPNAIFYICGAGSLSSHLKFMPASEWKRAINHKFMAETISRGGRSHLGNKWCHSHTHNRKKTMIMPTAFWAFLSWWKFLLLQASCDIDAPSSRGPKCVFFVQ